MATMRMLWSEQAMKRYEILYNLFDTFAEDWMKMHIAVYDAASSVGPSSSNVEGLGFVTESVTCTVE
jgi:hypothetical protein